MAVVPFPFQKRAPRPVVPFVPSNEQEAELARAFPSNIAYAPAVSPSPDESTPVAAPAPVAGIDPTVIPPSTGPAADWRMNRSPEPQPVAAPPPVSAPTDPARVTAAAPAPEERPGLGDAPPPPTWNPIVRDKQGRPTVSTTAVGPNAEILAKEKEAVDAYRPKGEPGWKRALRLGVGVGSIFASAAGRDPEGARRAGFGLGVNLANPKLPNESWKAARQADVNSQLNDIHEQEKDKAQVEHLKAESAHLNREPSRPSQVVKDKKGVYRVIYKDTGRDASGNLIEGEVQTPKGGFKGWAHDEKGIAHYFEGGTDTGKLDPGRNKVLLPDGRLVDPSQSYTAELGANKEDRGAVRANEAAKQENDRLDLVIRAANDEKAKVWAERDKLEAKGQKTIKKKVWNGLESIEQETLNPAWEELDRRGHELDDDIRRFETQKKPIVTPTAVETTTTKQPPGTKKYKVDKKFLQ